MEKFKTIVENASSEIEEKKSNEVTIKVTAEDLEATSKYGKSGIKGYYINSACVGMCYFCVSGNCKVNRWCRDYGTIRCR